MGKLEDKIVSGIYRYEATRTGTGLLVRLAIFIAAAFGAYIFGSILFEDLAALNTLEVLSGFTGSIEELGAGLNDALLVFRYEIPYEISLLWIVATVLAGIVMLTFIRNFEKMKNRIVSLTRHFSRRG